MGQKARIKGTEFELQKAVRESGRDTVIYYDGERAFMIPADWVEFYDPPREEPIVKGSIEVGHNGTVYVRTGGNGRQAWRWTSMDGSHGLASWTEMQGLNGPTKPMAVAE